MKKKVLILGGTQFIGRNLVERLLPIDSFDITLFNRQETEVNIFPDVKKIKGDRSTNDIKQIKEENWDFVIDLSCYYPHWLKNSLTCLNSNLEKYIFISSCSVYDYALDQSPLKKEHVKTQSCNEEEQIDESLETYSKRKAECERIFQNFGQDYLILRPSVVYGKYDHTDRFYYWLHQVKYSDSLLIPDNGEPKFSLTYVHDLVDVIIEALYNNVKNDMYNIVSSPQVSIKSIASYAMEFFGSNNKLINAAPEFLKENNVSQWFDMPFWLDGDFFTHNNQKYRHDFKLEPTELKKGIIETIKYYNAVGWKVPKYGMSEKMRMVLLKKINKNSSLVA